MGKKLEFSIIGKTEIRFRLEIQYLESKINEIHPSRLTRPGEIPIIFSKEDDDYQSVLDCARRMQSIYPPNEWRYVIGMKSSSCQPFID